MTTTRRARAYDAAMVAGLLPEIEVEIDTIKRSIETKALQMIKDCSMTGDQAMSLWAEWAGADAIGRKLRTRVAVSGDDALVKTMRSQS